MDKTQAIKESSPPRNVRQVREFVGICNYFRASVKDFAQKAAPLNRLTAKDSGWKGGELPEEALRAYEELKESLLSPPVLAYPDPSRDYHLVVDASIGSEDTPGGIGASLIQFDDDDNPRAVGYVSRGLVKHENNYSAFLLEMQACVFGIEYFQVYLTGKHFYLYTDHKPIEKLSSVHKRTLNRLQQMMMEYSFTIRYKPGKDNVVADYLSRNPISAIDIGRKELVEMQEKDELIKQIKKDLASEKKTKLTSQLEDKVKLDNGILYYLRPEGGRAIFAAQEMVPAILKAAHDSRVGGHLGMFKSRERILERYFWPGLRKDVQDHVQACRECARVKPWSKPARVPLKPIPLAASPNHRIHVDLFGPLKVTEGGKKYVCVITDAFSKYVELAAIPDKSAKTVARTIMDNWVCRFSTPKEIVTDGGKEFANELLNSLCAELQVIHKSTTPYHPQTNGAVEVFNRTMKHYLATAIAPPYTDWELLLPALRLCYNTSVSKATQMTPFSLVYGMDANMPFFDLEKTLEESLRGEKPEFLVQLARMRKKANEINLQYQETLRKFYDKKHKVRGRNLAEGDLIYVENNQKSAVNPKLQPSWLGPFVVVEADEVNVKYRQGKKVKAAHLNRVKSAKEKVNDDEFPDRFEEEIMQEFALAAKKKNRRTKRRKFSEEFVAIRPKDQMAAESTGRPSSQAQESEPAGSAQIQRLESEDEEMFSAESADSETEKEHSESDSEQGNLSKSANEAEVEDWEVTNYATPLPEDSWLPSPAQAGSWRKSRVMESDDETGSSEEDRDGAVCFTGDRSHVYPNDVIMKTARKRKPTSPVAPEEPKLARQDSGRTLRSKGLVLEHQPIPIRPLEWKPTRNKPAREDKPS